MARKPMTPEQKAALVERLKKGKAAKEAGLKNVVKPVVTEPIKPEVKKEEPKITEPVQTIAKEEPKVEVPTPAEAVVASPANQAQPILDTDSSDVTLKSADGRKLELSINDKNYLGLEITVPKDMEATARRTLTEGGFFLKD